jgi:hypothetical protein
MHSATTTAIVSISMRERFLSGLYRVTLLNIRISFVDKGLNIVLSPFRSSSKGNTIFMNHEKSFMEDRPHRNDKHASFVTLHSSYFTRYVAALSSTFTG